MKESLIDLLAKLDKGIYSGQLDEEGLEEIRKNLLFRVMAIEQLQIQVAA